jgi:hypothetical protein
MLNRLYPFFDRSSRTAMNSRLKWIVLIAVAVPLCANAVLLAGLDLRLPDTPVPPGWSEMAEKTDDELKSQGEAKPVVEAEPEATGDDSDSSEAEDSSDVEDPEDSEDAEDESEDDEDFGEDE